MLKDITLGQYFPGNTLAHRLDPRTKLMMVVIYIIALFCAKSFFSYGLLALFLLISVKISKVGFRALIRGMKPLIFILIFTAVLNMFYTPGQAIGTFWIFTLTVEGVWAAVFMVIRIALLIMGTFLMTYTTSPIALTDAIENLLGPLKRLHVPVHELAMMMSIALRFIPTLIEETDKIMSAQKASGADFETGNILRRAKALVPILVPLFISARSVGPTNWLRPWNAVVTTVARAETKLYVLRYQRRDFFCILLTTLITAAVVLLSRLGL